MSKLKDPNVLNWADMVKTLRAVQHTLWMEEGVVSAEKEWDSDTMSVMAGIMHDAGLGPRDRVYRAYDISVEISAEAGIDPKEIADALRNSLAHSTAAEAIREGLHAEFESAVDLDGWSLQEEGETE